MAEPDCARAGGAAPSAELHHRLRQALRLIGPGVITGAADDDPSGIATYSQAGAQYGFNLTWTTLFSWPLMAAIQEVSARIGRVTGHGIAGNLRRNASPALLYGTVGLLLFANIINLGADLGAMGAALNLLVGGPQRFYVVVFAVGCAGLEIFLSYHRYVAILKWLTLSLFAYVAAALVVHIPWAQVGVATFVPDFQLQKNYLVDIVAVLGTTISPYLFFWQASEEVEDEEADPAARPLRMAPEQAPHELRRIRRDTYFGMALSNLVAFFIIVTTAATLHNHGVTDIQTSAQAAEALRPIAGEFAFAVFAMGIIGTGLLAIPVFAGSAAYALGEALGWPVGLERRPLRAKAFYATIAVSTLLGIGINFTSLDPIKALFWSAVVNGIVAVPLMVVMMLMARRKDVMGDFTVPAGLWVFGWLATAVMGVTAAAMLLTAFA